MRIALVGPLLLLVATVWACGDDSETVPSGPATSSTGAGASGPGGAGGGGVGGTGSGGSGGAPVPMNHYLYVANRSDDTLTRFAIDETSGVLTDLGTTDIAGGPGPISLSPDQHRLYLGLQASQSAAAFDISAADGSLSLINTISVGIDPVYAWVDATGGNLLMSSYGQNAVRIHPIAGDGSIGASATESLATGVNPHSIITDPSNGYAFVPLTNNNPDQVLQFVFDAQAGTLTANGQALATSGSGPRHMAFHPTGPWLYVVNEHEDSVTLYDFDATDGTLAMRQTWTTLPGGFNGNNNTCADIHVTTNGMFLYASNRGHDSLAMFSIAASDGSLTPLGQEPTEATPREFEVALDKFVYAAGQDSDALAGYTIDAGGTLTPIDVYPVGAQPLWVTAVSLPAP